MVHVPTYFAHKVRIMIVMVSLQEENGREAPFNI